MENSTIAFDELFKNTFIQTVIQNKINEEVEKVKLEKDTEIKTLQGQIDSLTTTILMNGGSK